MAYIYQAALYCDDCGLELRRAIPGDEFLGDSCRDSECFPQYCGENGGESDSPQHCDRCDEFLRNQLTGDGRQYVFRQIWEKGLASESLREWADFYGISCDDHPDGLEIIRDWRHGSWRLQMWDCNAPLTERPRLGYRFTDNDKVIFFGEDIRCPQDRCTDSIETLASTLSSLSLRPGDTDAEYFASYTPEQSSWAETNGEELGWIASEIEEIAPKLREALSWKHLGTVSWGTHRNQDLIPKFLAVLEEIDPEAFARCKADFPDLFDAETGKWESEDADYLVEELFETLSACAPEGLYFGAHVDDGADFGFWIDQELLEKAKRLGLDPEEVRP